ncbi:S8 family serine peptidase [Corynebacterium camporealensis]
MRRHLALGLTTTALLACTPVIAHATEPDTECAVGKRSATGPQPTSEQREYRERLHALATGKDVKVAVIDTGVATHEQLPKLEGGADFVTPDDADPHFDCDVHGTVVAGIIGSKDLGLAPAAELRSIRQSSAHYRQEDNEDEEGIAGAGSMATLADAIHDAVEHDADIINVSVVSCVPHELNDAVDLSPLQRAVGRAENEGTLIVAASGNAAEAGCQASDIVYPAALDTVLAVGAMANDYDLAEYSIPAEGVVAPGHVPLGLSPQGWATAKSMPQGAGQEDAEFHGTSFAAPLVSGTAALLAERHPDASPEELRELLLSAAEPGHGVIDPLTALSHQPANYTVDEDALQLRPAVEESNVARHRTGLIAAGCAGLLGLAAIWRGLRRR